MPDKKLTDNEIIKALECCSVGTFACDEQCPCFHSKSNLKLTSCRFELICDALDIINRQKAEIEFLKEQRDRYMQDATDFSIKVEQLKTENELLKLNVGDDT